MEHLWTRASGDAKVLNRVKTRLQRPGKGESVRSGRWVLALLIVGVAARAHAEVESALWGEHGEHWTPESRLPDFSFAGYQRGETPLPNPPTTHNVRDFGAVGDGEHDDSEAFVRAIAAVSRGVIRVPEGRYRITRKILIDKPGIVIRGDGPTKTVLFFPTPLNEIEPNWGATTSGQRTSNYSWSGGFLAISGKFQRDRLAAITSNATRGAMSVDVDDASVFSVGQQIEVRQVDDNTNSLARHLYSGDPRESLEKLEGRVRASLVTKITSIDAMTVHFDRPLRCDIRAVWKPAIYQFEPAVTESGIEEMRFEFPNTPYQGHFSEVGYNAFAIANAAHCWVRNVHIHNADSGGFVSGVFNTVDGVTFTSERAEDANRQSTGHHGITLSGNDNLCTNFDVQSKFIHDLTVSRCAGNVFSNGRGADLALDHHKHAPYENLFTNIDVGKATRVWRCGGGRDLGAHCAARGTFWNVHGAKVIDPPDANFGPWSMNFIGVHMDAPSATDPIGRWYEWTGVERIAPANLHEAQVERRMGQ